MTANELHDLRIFLGITARDIALMCSRGDLPLTETDIKNMESGRTAVSARVAAKMSPHQRAPR